MSTLDYPTSRPQNLPFVTFSFFDNTKNPTGNPVILFMPPAFQITDGHEYEFAKQGTVSTIMNMVTSGDFIGAGKDLAEKVRGGFFKDDYAQALAAAGRATRDPKFFNYKEPRPREFTFTYKFEPKNQNDAVAMMDIINRFRIASYPVAIGGGRQYQVPDSVKIQFTNIATSLAGANPSVVLPNFFAIKEVNTTISEGEQVTTLGSTGLPSQVSLQIQFSETVLLTKKEGGDSLIGDEYSQASTNGIPGL